MIKSQNLDRSFCVGDVLVSDRFKGAVNFPRIFKTHRVDNDFGVVYYKHNGKEDTVGTAYVRKAKKWEQLFYCFCMACKLCSIYVLCFEIV
jgi:hypothetical protein